ncbi:beta-lactamase class A [Actinacidiphila yanglinensis]|uniref:Beta-lactamase class A n=1 Tax=Actinacidiphila yanglinensis TaxID=310779 RepID=A0A1H6D5E7_9ACTN|nr:class A beta-lactamase [Actinacidiphila yanglinensis]SEG80522.1 beta-lactamase class A [Actinacidiphila yanglinensis]
MHHAKHRTRASASTLLALAALLAACGGGGGSGGGSSSGAAHAAPSAGAATSDPATSAPASSAPDGASRSLAALESRFHAHVGLFALDTGSGRTVAYQADRRFAHCSTVKVLAAAVLLKRESDAGLDRVITYPSSDLVTYSPVTSKHAGTVTGKGMPLRDVIDAALRYSDNTAENLMLDQLGGPPGLQKAVHALGDTTTRVDRPEPALNDATPGDVRDTSTAGALGADLRRLLLGDVLPAERRSLLVDLMVRNTTGGPYVRAGVPAGWKVADKTGSGGYGTRNDIAVAWPPHGSPVVISVLTDRGATDAASADALVADATKAALTELGS